MASTQDFTNNGGRAPRQGQFEQGKQAAATQVERVASAVQHAATELGDGDGTLAGYATELSRGVQSLAENLRNRSVSDIAADMQTLARRNPTTFLLGSIAVGLALGRFMKASSARAASPPGNEPDTEYRGA